MYSIKDTPPEAAAFTIAILDAIMHDDPVVGFAQATDVLGDRAARLFVEGSSDKRPRKHVLSNPRGERS